MKSRKRSSKSNCRQKNFDPILFEKQEAEANKKKAQLKKYENAQLSCLACSLIPEIINLDFTSGVIHISCIVHNDSQIYVHTNDFKRKVDLCQAKTFKNIEKKGFLTFEKTG